MCVSVCTVRCENVGYGIQCFFCVYVVHVLAQVLYNMFCAPDFLFALKKMTRSIVGIVRVLIDIRQV